MTAPLRRVISERCAKATLTMRACYVEKLECGHVFIRAVHGGDRGKAQRRHCWSCAAQKLATNLREMKADPMLSTPIVEG